jgi:hypothetical protein
MLQLLTYIAFLGEAPVYLQLSSIGLFLAQRAYLHLETPKLQEVFLLKTNSVLTGKKCAEGSCC